MANTSDAVEGEMPRTQAMDARGGGSECAPAAQEQGTVVEGEEKLQAEPVEETPPIPPEADLSVILARFGELSAELRPHGEAIRKLQFGQDTLAEGVRGLADTVEGAIHSFSEPRIRDLLNGLLLLHDLVEQMANTTEECNSSSAHRRNYGVLLSQILQILRVHGIEIIPTDVPFDADIHNALMSCPTNDAVEDGKISRVFKKGFRSKHRVLRCALVEVKTLVEDSGSIQPPG